MPFIHPACRAYTARTYGWDDIEVAMQPLCVPHVGELLTSQDFYGHHQAWLSLILQETRGKWGLFAVRETQRTSYEDWCFSLR